MSIHRSIITAILSISLAATTASGAPSKVKSDVPPALAKQAKIALETARATALAKVKGGTVISEELERERGKLVYSFDVTLAGKSGATEVLVDARTGKIVSVTHETAAREKREASEEAKPSDH